MVEAERQIKVSTRLCIPSSPPPADFLPRRPYWFLLYITETLLFTTGAYPVILNKMSGFVLFFGHEQQILNGLWLGLVGIEILMVLGATGIFVARSFQSAPKQKAQ